MSDFIKDIVINALQVILPIFIGYIAVACKKLYTKVVNNKMKEDIAKNVVLCIEQTFKDLHGKDKLDKAKESLITLLAQQNIKVTDNELTTLIESSVAQFNEVFKSTES